MEEPTADDGGFSRPTHFSTGIYIEKSVLDARERAESKKRWLDENKVGLKITVPSRKTGCEPFPSNAVAEGAGGPASAMYVEPATAVTASRLKSKTGWLETERNGGRSLPAYCSLPRTPAHAGIASLPPTTNLTTNRFRNVRFAGGEERSLHRDAEQALSNASLVKFEELVGH